jgi:hypothetical protein
MTGQADALRPKSWDWSTLSAADKLKEHLLTFDISIKKTGFKAIHSQYFVL